MGIGTDNVSGIQPAQRVYPVDKVEEGAQKGNNYGKTIGEPQLSDTAQKYYEQLKKKFGQYDFILVSKDQMENAKANASKYANGLKTVVLIDEEKIEKMATDEKFRKKYEGILSGAEAQMEQLKAGMAGTGANVKGYGMQVNDDGTLSYFAVLKESSAAQRERIEKHAEEKKIAKKEADRKADKLEREERIRNHHIKNNDEGDEKTKLISADTVEDLIQKIGDYVFDMRSNSVQTEEEKMLGQHFDFRG